MTFEQWWKDSEKSVYWCNNPDIRSLCKCIAQSAWQAAQPKWKDAQKEPPKEAGSYLCIWNNGFYNVQQACMYDAPTKMFITNTLFPVIAWMPLPEADDGIL